MTLDVFASSLFENGTVVMAREVSEFSSKEMADTEFVLREQYMRDINEMPRNAPEFSYSAALWAISYFYRAVQLVMLRELGEDKVNELLPDYQEEKTTSAIYSVDLVFRFLPDLFGLAKGLAPDDPLVVRLKQTSSDWPFSSFGIELSDAVNVEMILMHPALRIVFIDRLIKYKDIKKVNAFNLHDAIQEALGTHKELFWPEFQTNTYQTIRLEENGNT